MELNLRTTHFSAEVIIKIDNTKITEDLAVYNNGNPKIPNSEIMKFIEIAIQMNSFNGNSDVGFVKMIYDNILSDSERSDFLKLINSNI